MNYPAQIVVNVLHREFPDLAIKVLERIREQLPALTFDDIDIVEGIVDAFCQDMNVTKSQLYNAEMIKSNAHKRRILIALIMKLYQPELLVSMITGHMNSCISRKLIAILHVSRGTVSFDVKRAVKFYQLYSEFRESVDNMHTKIIQQYGNKENSIEASTQAV
ncbi:hypothetical protein [Sphingobacterium yanglingense]|nr:hypothetical protein [Sphingobacterium yanglingense]